MEIKEEIKKSATELIEKTKEDLSAENWLKKARGYEAKKDFKSAREAYLKFLEIKMQIIQKRPEYGMKSYLDLVKYYIKVAECYENSRHINPEERETDLGIAARYYIKAAEMFIESKDYESVRKYYETAAKCYESVKKYDKAAECHTEIANMYIKLKDKVLAISAYVNSAKFYEMIGDYKKAMDIWLNVADLNSDTGNILGASSGYKKVGDCYRKLGKYQDALSYYLRSADIIINTEHYAETAEIYESIASSYEDVKDYKNAIHYHMKSAELNIKTNEEAASSSYRGMAACYEKLGSWNDAISYYLKSCDIELKLKHYKNLVTCYKGMAKCYEEMKDYVKSADTYFQAAEYASMESKENKEGKESNEAKDIYRKATEIYNGIAEEKLNGKDYNGAIENYKKIADCYEKMGEYKESAEAYRKYGDVMKEIDYDDSMHAYGSAAERYAKAGNMKDAGYYYAKARDYANSAKFYKEYARLNKNDQILAAEGYRMAAHSYKKLKKTEDTKDYYNRAISQYTQHMQKLEQREEKVNKGELYTKIAECYSEIDDMPNTKKNLEEALKFYDASMEKQRIPADALLIKANAKLAMKIGEYSTANKLLNESLNLFDKSIREGNFDEDYNVFLEENKIEIIELLGQLKLKPSVVLEVEQPKQPLTPGMLEIKGVISNKGEQNVYGVLILPSTPQGFQVVKSPETIDALKPNESKEIVVQLNVSMAGEFKFMPLEVLYKDIAGNKYMKSSNEILIDTRGYGVHEEQKKEAIDLEKGFIYIVEDATADRAIGIFSDIIKRGAGGLYVSREHPDRIKEKFPSNVSVIWLSTSQKQKNVINPTDLVGLGHTIRDFIDKNKGGIVLLNGVEYLITQNGYDEVLKFIQSVDDTIASTNSRLLVPINPKALNLQQITLMERECKVL